MPISPCVNQISKVVRIRSLTPFLTRGEFKFKRGSRGARLLVDQLRDFPYGEFDDGADSLEMACRMAQRLRGPRPGQFDSGYTQEYTEM